MSLSGGCQCGAVRYRADRLGRASICHCRMCQKAFGSFFGPLVSAHDLVWTRGEPKRFASSNLVRRGFCEACGTPLTYEWGTPGENPVEVSIGSLDNPEFAPPTVQVNPADRLSVFARLHTLPVRGETPEARGWLDRIISRQHPDRDTRGWSGKDWTPE